MAADGAVISEARDAQGMAHCVTAGFAQVLATHLEHVAAPADWPVLICGMAGARQGWAETLCTDLPALA